MPATDKSTLLKISDKEWQKLSALLASVPDEMACLKDKDDTSIKDVVGHRAHWIDLFLGWYHDGQAGKAVAFPAPGYKWSELKAYNAVLRDRQAGLSWSDAQALLESRHKSLMQLLSDLDNDALYAGPMKGAQNDKWTTGRWAEASGPSHYRSAAKYIRARLRAGQ